jgi:hypothetical protein
MPRDVARVPAFGLGSNFEPSWGFFSEGFLDFSRRGFPDGSREGRVREDGLVERRRCSDLELGDFDLDLYLEKEREREGEPPDAELAGSARPRSSSL